MPRPVATRIQIVYLLQSLRVEGDIGELELAKLLRSSCVRRLQRKAVGVAKALKAELSEMQTRGELNIISPVQGARRSWGYWGNIPGASVHVVIVRMTRWIAERVNKRIRTTVAQARDNFKKQYKSAGGISASLTKEIKSVLLSHAMQGNLILDKSVTGAISLFSGGQSSDAPVRLSGLLPTHVDMLSEYIRYKNVGNADAHAVYVRESTDLRKAPYKNMISWIQTREGLSQDDTCLVLAGIPCHTWTNLNNTLRALGNEYRDKMGNPTDIIGPKRDEAISQTLLAQNTVLSIIRWVEQGAFNGWQRHFVIENPAYGTLRLQPFMKSLPVQKVAHYCMYETTMASAELYPSNKPTAIWTNVKGWVPRVCPRTGNHAPHEATIGGNTKKRPGVTRAMDSFTPWAAKRWTPQTLLHEILLCR
jgi:hypothetical protein